MTQPSIVAERLPHQVVKVAIMRELNVSPNVPREALTVHEAGGETAWIRSLFKY
jgi:hypothetical protein